MATPTTRTPPSSANLSAQPSSRSRDWSRLRSGEPGSAFLGLRGRGARGGGARGGRGGGRPPSSPTIRDGKLPHPEPSEIYGSQPDISTPKAKPPSVRKGSTQSVASITTSEKPPASLADRVSKPKTPSRRTSRSVPVLTVAPASPTPDSVQNVPLTPSRGPNRRRRSQQHTKPPSNGTSKPNIPSSTSLHPQKPKTELTSSSIAPRKDVPPHLVAAHEAEIRHGIDALVERVRAVAMAENRPSTPGSHIDWAGDEDDSLPDLDDWGVVTTNTSTGNKEEEISPILADTLRPLPEPQTEGDAEDGEEQHTEPSEDDEINQDSSAPSPLSDAPVVQDTSVTTTIDVNETPTAASETITQGENPSLHPSLSAKPVVAIENHRASSAPVPVGEESLAKREGISQSIHAPSQGDALERTLSSSSSDHGLAASIHAPKNLPESHSTPSLLNPGAPSSVRTFSPSHGRSKTEGRGAFSHPRAMPATAVNQRTIRSGTSSPLGPHTSMHGRNHSTPPGGAGQRAPHSTRPVITGDAISRLARTIMPVIPRAQSVAVAKD